VELSFLFVCLFGWLGWFWVRWVSWLVCCGCYFIIKKKICLFTPWTRYQPVSDWIFSFPGWVVSGPSPFASQGSAAESPSGCCCKGHCTSNPALLSLLSYIYLCISNVCMCVCVLCALCLCGGVSMWVIKQMLLSKLPGQNSIRSQGAAASWCRASGSGSTVESTHDRYLDKS